jgi:SPP1 family phage portal protein
MDIVEIIKEDIKKKKDKYKARDYYNYNLKQDEDNEIHTASNGEIHTFKKENTKELYVNYFKILVKQKINYLLAKTPELETKDDYTVTTIKSMLKEAGLNACLDSTAWLHFYVEENRLDWIFVEDKEIIPMYDKYKKKIIEVIRYYEVDKDTIRVEIWNDKGVTIQLIEKEKVIQEKTEYHYYDQYKYQDNLEDIQGRNFTFIPFIPMFNNDEKKSELTGDLRALLDMFNEVSSGFVANINKFQESIIKLKGFAGDSDELEKTMTHMKKYKMVGIPSAGNDGADIEYMAVEIPVEARQVVLELLKDAIFQVGEGMDPNKKITETNITNVVIKSRYSALDMKANEFETEMKLFYEKFVTSLNEYYRTSLSEEITFNRSMIFNESEQIDNCIKSMGLVPMEIILDNHPWISDSKKALTMLEKEKEENIKQQQKMMEVQDNGEKSMKTDDLKE